MWRCKLLPCFAMIFFTTIAFVAPEQTTGPNPRPLLRQVDHILIEAADTRKLFDFLTETLRLPIAWPLTEYPGFSSGGASAGNVNIEVLSYSLPRGARPARRPAARFIGLALEPLRLTDCLAELQVRGVPHDPPEPHISKLPDGSLGTLWTNVGLPRLSDAGLSVFLCEYSSSFLHAEIRRNQLGGQLALRKGGPLGVRSVKEVVVTTTDLARCRSEWERLSIVESASPAGMLPVGNGPAIRLVPASTNRIQRIVLKVNALKPARDFLEKNRLLGAASAGEVTIAPATIQGLGIRLVEE